MVISDKKKYIFIAVPKTGTTAIHAFLLDNDPSAIKNELPIQKVLEENLSKVNGHIRSIDLKKRMGPNYDDYLKFAFVRHPYAKAVSAYFFYKNGKPITAKNNRRLFYAKMNIYLAQLLPFSIWSLLAPLKTNVEYLTNEDGKIIVDFIGLTESLDEHLVLILKEIGFAASEGIVEKKNTSKHKHYNDYFTKKWQKWLFNKRHAKEMNFYNGLLTRKLPLERLRDLKIH